MNMNINDDVTKGMETRLDMNQLCGWHTQMVLGCVCRWAPL
jgi:hypothetical protein